MQVQLQLHGQESRSRPHADTRRRKTLGLRVRLDRSKDHARGSGRPPLRGTGDLKTFQAWIAVDGPEDVTFAYPGDAYGLTIGAENTDGTRGGRIPAGTGAASDYRVTSTRGAPGESLTYTLKVKGVSAGEGMVTTATSTEQVKGVTVEVDRITVQ